MYVEERTIDVHIRRLRKALEDVSMSHLVQTVRGSGYRFSAQGSQTHDARAARAWFRWRASRLTLLVGVLLGWLRGPCLGRHAAGAGLACSRGSC